MHFRNNDCLWPTDLSLPNALRNRIAHAFFPENLRSAKSAWKGKDIFTLEGIRAFMEDMAEQHDFSFHKMKAW